VAKVSAILRGVCAALISAVVASLGFLFLGLLPIWSMILLYGRQNVQDSAAHGGMILFVTLPVAGVLSACGFCFLTPVIYQKLSKHRGR
jgi:hypothetical protein